MSVGLILALDCKVSSLYQRSVIVMNSKAGHTKGCLTSLSIRLTVVEVKG